MNDLLVDLTYPEALGALRLVAKAIATKEKKKLEDFEAGFRELVKSENSALADTVASGTEDWARVGPGYIGLLQTLLDSGDDFLRKATQSAIQNVKGKGQAHGFIAIALTVGGIVFALGLLSKIGYSKKKGFTLEPGFPGLEKTAKVVSAFFGHATDQEAKDAKPSSKPKE